MPVVRRNHECVQAVDFVADQSRDITEPCGQFGILLAVLIVGWALLSAGRNPSRRVVPADSRSLPLADIVHQSRCRGLASGSRSY